MHKIAAGIMLLGMSLSAFAGDKPKPYQYIPLFMITKDVNENKVIYEASVTQDCRFMEKDEFRIYWILEDGTSEGLNFFEKRVYPIDQRSKTDRMIVGDIKAFKGKDLNYPIAFELAQIDGKCEARVSARDVAIVTSVHLSKFKGREPTNITVIGTDEKGRPVSKEILSKLLQNRN